MENIQKLDFKVSIYAFYKSKWDIDKIFVGLAPVVAFWCDLICVDRSYIIDLMHKKFNWCDIYSEYTFTDCKWEFLEIYWVDGINEHDWVELNIECIELLQFTWLYDSKWDRIYEWDILWSFWKWYEVLWLCNWEFNVEVTTDSWDKWELYPIYSINKFCHIIWNRFTLK